MGDTYDRQNPIDQVGRGVEHSAAGARGTESSPLAREADDDLMATGRTDDAAEAPVQDPAAEGVLEFPLDEPGKSLAEGTALLGFGEEGRQVLFDHFVEDGLLGLAPPITR